MHGRPTAHVGEDDAPDLDTEHFTAAKPTTDAMDDECVPKLIPLEAQVRIPQTLAAIKEQEANRSFGIPDKSLEAHVFRLAYCWSSMELRVT